jgi:ribonuclease BN (tRNA processing enzyme)
MNTKKLNKNWMRMEEKIADEPTYVKAVEIREKALNQMEIIREKTEKLEAELSELNYLKSQYDNIECSAEVVAENTKEWLDYMGFPANSNKRQTERAYQEYQELECYIGEEETLYAFGNTVGSRVRIQKLVYKGDGNGGILRDEKGSPVELSVLELCSYYPEYKN